MASTVPSTAGFITVDTSSPKTVQLPLTTLRLGRVLSVKDRTGQANVNPITIQTQGGDTFENGATSYLITTSFGSATFVARSGQWILSQGTQSIQASTIFVQSLLSTSGSVNASSMRANFFIGDGSLLSNLPPINQSLISTPFLNTTLQSTITGLGSSSYISSLQLLSTTRGLETYISSFIDPTELTSSITSTVFGIGLASNLTSTTIGLGTLGYISSQQLISTTRGLETYISSFIDPTELTSSITSTVFGIGLASNLTSTTIGLGTIGYISSQQLISTTRGLETYISSFIDPTELTSSITSTVFGIGIERNLTSTTIGLGTLGYISSQQLISTTRGLETYISSFIDPTELTSSITSTVFGIGLAPNLTSTTIGLGTIGYISTSGLVSTTQSLLGISSFLRVSTGNITTSTATFIDTLNTNSVNTVYVRSTFLYYNNYVIGGTTQLQPQIFIF